MRIYRRVIPKISKDIIRNLLAAHGIEIDDGRRDETELQVAAAIVGYLDAVDELSRDAREIMEQHHFGAENMGRVRRTLSLKRKLPLGEDARDYIIDQMIASLFECKHVAEVFFDDNELRLMINETMSKYIGVDAELDREIRGRLKNLREGTAEWEHEYGQMINNMRNQSESAHY